MEEERTKIKKQSRIMNTIKNIFITYGGYILLMFLGANFMYILLMLLSLSRNTPIPDPELIYTHHVATYNILFYRYLHA